MAQTTQIVPKFSFPYVETVINDYTQVSQTADDNSADPTVKYVFPFISSKGIDNTFIRKRSKSSFIKTYGDSNYKKYGQPLMMPLAVLAQDNTSAWCMRVMPENAAFSNAVVSLYSKVDAVSTYTDEPSKRKFRIKFTQKSLDDITTSKLFIKKSVTLDGETTKVDGEDVYKDSEGYVQYPIIAYRSSGRGTYGNTYCVRTSQNVNYEKEYGIKMYNFDILTIDGGLIKDANYIGALSTSNKYAGVATLVNDILEDTETGLAPVDIRVIEENIEAVYDKYIAFCKEQNPLLKTEYASKSTTYAIPDGMLEGTVAVTSQYTDKVKELKSIKAMIDATEEANLPDLDEFDPLFGIKVASTDMLPFIQYVQPLTADIDTEDEGYDAKEYTETTNLANLGSTKGVVLSKGANGYFDDPRTVQEPESLTSTKWTYEDELNECYKNAFNGTYDRRILASRRIPATAFFDANYDMDVKQTMVDLALVRNDCLCYLDEGISAERYSGTYLSSLIEDYSVFDNKLISKNLQHYIIKEETTQKRVPVSITYFLSQQYAYHMSQLGSHIPMVKDYAQLTGHIKDSLQPSIEDYETDLKETLYDNRFNYFETLDENVFQRATQSTSQMIETDLMEESNTTTLFIMKREIEKDVQSELYNFADESIRSTFTATERDKFSSWVGDKILSMDIEFTANEWESEHSILHVYLSVVFRGLQKRAIVEIDVNKRTYTSDTDNASATEE